ncbi:hypothetical protein ACHAPU_010406 [Fusarium lateritium]
MSSNFLDIIDTVPIPAQAMPDIAQSLIDALGTLEPFQCSDYLADVKTFLAVTTTDFATAAPSKLYGEDPAGDSMVTQNFKVGTVALGVARSTAGHGFKDTVNLKATKALLVKNAQALVIPMYRDFLEAHLEVATGNTWDLVALLGDSDFCESFAIKVFNPIFINNYLYTKVSGALQYIQAIRYLFERARVCLQKSQSDTPIPIPSCYATVPPTLSNIANSSLRQNAIFIAIAQDNANVQANTAHFPLFLNAVTPFTWNGQDPLVTPNFPEIGALWSTLWISDGYATDVASTLINQSSDITAGYSRIGNVMLEYGKDLWNWMKEQESLSTYESIFAVPKEYNNECFVSGIGDFGCFSTGTLVETATGSSEIQNLQTGAKILTKARNEFAILSDERVIQDVTPQSAGRFERHQGLYGFNGEKPFVTAGHIFFTTAGPKAIEPDVALMENPYVDVGYLEKGDVLLKLKPDRSGYDQIEISSIESGIAHCSTVHGLHFAVGGGRYHANGYWVADNYPRLTMQSLAQRVFGKTAESRGKTKSLPLPNPAAVSPVHQLITSERRGRQSLKRITGEYHLINKAAIDQSKTDIDPRSPSFPGMVQKLNGSQPLPTIQVSEGKVLVDGQVAQHAAIHHSGIEWSHPVAGSTNGVYQHGILRPIDEGSCLVGVVGSGPKDAESTDDLKSIQTVSAFLAPNSYSLIASPATYPTQAAADSASPSSDETWTPFWKVTIGYAVVNGAGTIQVALPDLDAEYTKQTGISGTTLYSVGTPMSTNSMLTVTITVGDPSMLKYLIKGWTTTDVTPGPLFSSITILRNPQTNAMHGDYEPPVPSGGNLSIYAIVATDPGSSAAAVKSAMQKAVKASPFLPSLMLMADVTNASSSVHQPPLPATMALAPLTFSSEALSAADLMNVTVATPDDLQNLSQNYIIDAANFYRAQEEDDVFGSGKQTGDAIPTSLKQGLQKDQTMFLGNYSKALIMQGLSYNGSYAKSFTKSDTDTMRYYFTGSAKECISQDPSFNSLAAVAARNAFIAGNAQLQSYIDDPQDWALLLFRYLMKDPMLVNAAVQSVSLGDVQMNKYCMLLDVLDAQGRNFSMLYIKALRLKVGLQLSYGNIAVGSNFGAQLQAIIAQIINSVIANPQDIFYQLFSEDVQALQKEYSTDVATTIAEQAFSTNSGIGLGLTWAITSMSTMPTKATKVAAETVAQAQVVGEGTGRCGKMFKAIKEKCTTPKALRVFGAMKTLVSFA